MIQQTDNREGYTSDTWPRTLVRTAAGYLATCVYFPTLICGAAPHWDSAAEKIGRGIFPHWLTDEHLEVLRSDKQECRLTDDIGCLLLDKRNVCRQRKGFVVKLPFELERAIAEIGMTSIRPKFCRSPCRTRASNT